MRECLTLLILLGLGAPAFGEQVQAEKPRTFVVCEEVATAIPICAKPCTTWAKSQPDFQYSFDACVANCQKQKQKASCAELPVR